MTFQEVIDDGKSDVNAFATFKNLSLQNLVKFVSEAIHELQKATGAVKKTVTVATSALDSAGSVAMPKEVTVPKRVTYTPTGGSVLDAVEIFTTSPDELARMKLETTSWDLNARAVGTKIYMALEENKLYFFPFSGLSGTFTLLCDAKLPVFADSRTADTASFWYNWTSANIATKAATVVIPQEFDDAEEAITSYVSARILKTIPGWERHFQRQYDDFLEKFEAAKSEIKDNQPTYPLNYKPTPNHGW